RTTRKRHRCTCCPWSHRASSNRAGGRMGSLVVPSNRIRSRSEISVMRKTFAAAVPITIPLLLSLLNGSTASTSPQTPTALVRYEALFPSPATLPQHSVVFTIEEDDTLGMVLVEGGLDHVESAALNRQFGRFIDLRHLRPGHLVRFHYADGGVVDSVEMRVRGWGEIDAIRSQDGFHV